MLGGINIVIGSNGSNGSNNLGVKNSVKNGEDY